MKLRLLFLTFLFSALSWGQATLPVNRTIWNAGAPVGWTDSGTGSYTSTFACSGSNGGRLDSTGDYYEVFFTGIPDQLSYTIKISGSSTSNLLVEESADGVIWTTVVDHTSISTTCTTFNHTLLATTQYVKWTYNKVAQNVTIDDVDITVASVTPTINVNPSSLSGMVYVVGSGPSAEQTFDISGSNLTTDITLTAPTNYEISTTSGAGFTNSIALTQSGGNVVTTTIYVRLKAGLSVATYSGEIISCTSTGATTQDVTCNGAVVNPSTPFEAGDFAVIALNSNISCYGGYTAGDDEISFITFRDIQNGDSFYMTDNGFERDNANEWGNTEGVYQFTRTGPTLTAGTVITFRLLNTSPFVEFNSPDASWSFVKVAGFGGNMVMNSGGDQIFFMQGGTWNNPGGTHDATYTPGTYLYAFNTNSSWTSFGGSTQQSGLPINLRCFSLMPGSATDYLEYTGPTSPADKLTWISRLNNPANWTDRTDCASYTGMHVGQSYTVSPSGTYIDGVWVGSKSTDWFDCGNWQTLQVPDETINVDINSTYAQRDVEISITSPNAPIYNNVALANDLSLTDRTLIIEANPLNVLEIHGNFLLDGNGTLDMDDANTATIDGTIHLYGNWTNNLDEADFEEGNGTVYFDGSVDQIISNVSPIGTEVFYDVVMNNNFITSVSNDLIANGDLIVNTGNTVTVNANDYIQVGFDLTVDGTFNVEDDGSLIQVDDNGVNTGNINYERTTTGIALDYVYWSSPVNGVTTPATGYVYTWNPTFANPNGGWGYWIGATNTSMAPGVGYIMRDVFSRTFTGVPRNGVIQPSISRANYTNVSGFTGTNGVLITRFDDNWNLVGNPYPSAISALDFLNANPNIEGAVRIWTHGTSPATSIADPVYDDYVYNYTVNDYIVYNGTGTVSGPAGFNGFIAGGQSFMINMNDGASVTETVTFNNSMRNRTHNNEQFYKQTSSTKNVVFAEEKHRIWLDLADVNNNSVRTLVGYVSGATTGKDRLYDAVSNAQSNGMNIFSIINDERMLIQGRGVPFDVNDKVQLSVNIPSSGLYSIGLSAVDGLFSDGQDIYLEDKALNIIFDIKQMPYTFYAEQGEFKNRFILRFTNETLGIEDTISEDSVAVFSQENNISISSASETIESVMVYNVLGQLLLKENNINSNNMVISKLTRNNQALIVRVNFNNGKEITRKIVF